MYTASPRVYGLIRQADGFGFCQVLDLDRRYALTPFPAAHRLAPTRHDWGMINPHARHLAEDLLWDVTHHAPTVCYWSSTFEREFLTSLDPEDNSLVLQSLIVEWLNGKLHIHRATHGIYGKCQGCGE